MNTMKARRMLACSNSNWGLFKDEENRQCGLNVAVLCRRRIEFNQHVPRPHTGQLWVEEHADSA